jgi:hypothetical protein
MTTQRLAALIAIVATGCLLATCAPVGAADPPHIQARWFDPDRYTNLLYATGERIQRWEAVAMASAIASGSRMGAGDGWFHPSQSRYGWVWLTARYDADRNGTITRQEFTAPGELFERLDRDRDGTLAAADFDWADRRKPAPPPSPDAALFRLLDADGNGRVSEEEWAAFFKQAAKDRDHLTPDDLRAAMTMPARTDGPTPELLLRGLLSGELGSLFEGPDLGQKAPDFVLETPDGKQEVRLSDHFGKKPVVLVFGSFT